MRSLFINLDEDDPAKAFVTSFTDDSPLVELPKWPRSDSKPLRLLFLRRNQDVNSPFPFYYVDPSGFSSVRFGGGVLNATPDGGTFTLTDPAGAQTTTAIAYNAPASGVAGSVQTVVRASLSTNYSAATVTGDAGGPYIIDRGATGAIADLTATATSLTPDGSTIVVTNTQVGSATLNERFQIRLVKALPILKASGWTTLPAATVTPSVVINGGANVQKVFRVVWNSDAYGGAVSLSVLGSVTTRTVGPIPYNANADDVADAFEAHTELATDGVTVVRNGPGDFTITILGAIGRATTPTVSTSSNTLLVPLGLTAVVSVATAGADDILDGEQSADITIEVEIRESSGEPNTCAQGTAKLIADLMEGTPGQSTGTEQWATIGDVEALVPHVFANDAARGTDTPEYTGQLGFQLDNGTWWHATGTTAGAWSSDVSASILAAGLNGSAGEVWIYNSAETFSARFTVSTLTGDRTLTAPDASGVIVLDTATQTLSGKTLTAPRIANGGFIADANGNELIICATAASAVNEITVGNAATGNRPRLEATGDDADIDIELSTKGNGRVYTTSQMEVGGTLTAAGGVDVSGGTLVFGAVGSGVDAPVADGTYTMGLGLTQNGTITTRNGVIITVQEVI